MSHTYTNFLYHIVFSTKERLPLIGRELKPRLYDHIGGTVRDLGGIQLEIGGAADHVHILIKLKPTIQFSDLMRELKANTSKWANEITGGRFEWQDGYGAFTVGGSQVESVRRYIRDQEAHHLGISFEDEFKDLLRNSGIDFDERFL
ncbi:MAG TPA: IS200/IS605 family transposase [Pyrinomonadaceae bacterium]|jgi:REP element-mobilizing transposase RayT|nr:IS200/IS605 family transposase [Pyrinomonadaceae bacterium]